MTYQEKLDELRRESLSIQRDFLKIIVEIRESGKTAEGVEEKRLFERDRLYGQFNRILKIHGRITRYIRENKIDPALEFSERPEFF